jgi:hypothetical protein
MEIQMTRRVKRDLIDLTLGMGIISLSVGIVAVWLWYHW